MLSPRDLYCYASVVPIGTVGQCHIVYEIHRYRDVRSLGNTLAYLVVCTQRVILPNATPYTVGPSTGALSGYSNYPAALTSSIGLTTNAQGSNIVLRELFPRTLNAQITTSQEIQSAANVSASTQQTSGSSTSQSNSFGVAVSGGFFGELPVGSLSVDYQHAWGTGTFESHGSGAATGHQAGKSGGETMSIKDWSSYGQVGSDGLTPTWVWGQSYPWDVILYNQSTDGNTIVLPAFVQARMMTTITDTQGVTTLALPPSQLSLFGLDFTMKASWLIEFPEPITASETLTATHNLSSFTGSHAVTGTGTQASLTVTLGSASPSQLPMPALDLSTYALDPIVDSTTGGALNFLTDSLFTYPPTAQGGPFKIVSAANNLQVTGTGFGQGMATDFAAGNASFTVLLKIVDIVEEYSLMLHHWIGQGCAPVMLTLSVNGNPTTTLFVEATEGQGGQGNISTLALRDLNFASVSFHDYLQLGLNVIAVTAAPVTAGGTNGYTLAALAIG